MRVKVDQDLVDQVVKTTGRNSPKTAMEWAGWTRLGWLECLKIGGGKNSYWAKKDAELNKMRAQTTS